MKLASVTLSSTWRCLAFGAEEIEINEWLWSWEIHSFNNAYFPWLAKKNNVKKTESLDLNIRWKKSCYEIKLRPVTPFILLGHPPILKSLSVQVSAIFLLCRAKIYKIKFLAKQVEEYCICWEFISTKCFNSAWGKKTNTPSAFSEISLRLYP